jgi:Cdc6-like AAA superfamily ATPase
LYKNIIFFEKYSKDQLFKILKERSKLGFLPNTISDNLLLKIAEFTQSNGDARFSIEFLWRIAKKFEYSKTNESLEESFSNILTEIIPFSKEILNDLSLPQTIFLLSIIQCLERNPEQIFVTLSQVKSEFQIKCQELKLKIGSGNTSLWNHLQVLKKLEIIEIDVVSKNYRGRFSKIYLKAPKQIIKSELLSKIEKEL